MLKPKLMELIESINAEEQALFTRLPEAERSQNGQADKWSPKDVLAHLAVWKERTAANLAAAAGGKAVVKYDEYQELNDKDFEAYREKSWKEILEKAAEANRRFREQVEGRSEEDLKAAWDENRKVWQAITGTGYVHPLIHLGQIYVERGEREYGTKLQEKAAAELLGLDEGPSWQGTVRYNLACHYAQIGEKEKAINGLKEALELNPELTDWSKEDPDFASIREEPGYKALYQE